MGLAFSSPYLPQPLTEKVTVVETDETQKLTFGVCSMQGWRQHMEDAHITKKSENEKPTIFGIFDGHGGKDVAVFCEKNFIQELEKLDSFQKGYYDKAIIETFCLLDVLLENQSAENEKTTNEFKILANRENQVENEKRENSLDNENKANQIKNNVFKAYETQDGNKVCQLPEHRVMSGCTAIVVAVDSDSIITGWAGDSRSVLCRDGVGIPLSIDHKPNDSLERMRIENAGGYVENINGQYRINGNLNLSRAIGDLKYKQNPTLSCSEQIIIANPDIKKVLRSPSDEFLIIACDGIWDVLDNQEACNFISAKINEHGRSTKAMKIILEELFNHCLSSDPATTRGRGCDNMTCILVFFSN